MSTLILRLSETGPAWARIDAAGAVLETGAGTPPQGAARIVVIVPGEDVVGHSLHLPAAGEAQTRAAARFAAEDELAVDAAGLHLAITHAARTAGAGGGARLVAVAARAAMESWLAQAQRLGAAPDAMLPAWAAIPAQAGECAVLIEGDIAHVTIAGAAGRILWGFSAETDLTALLLGPALERFDCRGVSVWGDPAQVAPPQGWGGRTVTRHAAPGSSGEDGALALLARGAAQSPLDLLQGEFAPRRAFVLDLGLWRRAAILAAAAFGAWLALTVAEAGALNRRAVTLRGEAEAAFAQAFPDEARIVNPRLQMQTRLSELRGAGGDAFLDLAALLAAAVAAQDGVEIGALRYQRGEGALRAELVMTDYADLQALRAAVAERGGVLEEGASRQADGRVSGDVTVRLP